MQPQLTVKCLDQVLQQRADNLRLGCDIQRRAKFIRNVRWRNHHQPVASVVNRLCIDLMRGKAREFLLLQGLEIVRRASRGRVNLSLNNDRRPPDPAAAGPATAKSSPASAAGSRLTRRNARPLRRRQVGFAV